MALTQAQKDRIVEEETVRLDARIKAAEAMGAKGCSRCGAQSGCRGCRIWGWIFAILALLCVVHFFCRPYACRMDGQDGRGMMGGMSQHMGAPDQGDQAPAKPAKPTAKP
ncbi:MAG TPA: hypothetical protein VNZ67_10255 [bacterium]|nr:hypothetical protein [bacterium]